MTRGDGCLPCLRPQELLSAAWVTGLRQTDGQSMDTNFEQNHLNLNLVASLAELLLIWGYFWLINSFHGIRISYVQGSDWLS